MECRIFWQAIDSVPVLCPPTRLEYSGISGLFIVIERGLAGFALYFTACVMRGMLAGSTDPVFPEQIYEGRFQPYPCHRCQWVHW